MASYDAIMMVFTMVMGGFSIAALVVSILALQRRMEKYDKAEDENIDVNIFDEQKKLVDTPEALVENGDTEGPDLEDTLNEVEQQIWQRESDAYFALYGKTRKLTPFLRSQIRKKALYPAKREG
jgi:hypothetical protein